ncbi:MAG: hypothetical protein EBU46_00905 [Nitrosomonadaceae bacterium]|nr:hypothetical protein [Nitrosomonadaceae bacterium]
MSPSLKRLLFKSAAEAPPQPPPPNPVQQAQQWQNEWGFIDSFDHPTSNPALTALQHGGVGLLSGTSASAATGDKHPWFSGLNTGLGTVGGNLLARGIASANNMSPDESSALGTIGSIGGGGAAWLLDKLRQEEQPKKKELSIPIPLGQLQFKTAGLTESLQPGGLLHSIKGQLPQIRLPDSLVGGAVGAAGGALYHGLSDDTATSEAQNSKTKWRRILGGAGVGALGANVVGDRARRYLANNMYPLGYASGVPGTELAPKSFKHIWDSAILDKPQQPEVQQYQAGKYQAPNTTSEDPTLKLFGRSRAELSARHELLRRGMGIHNEDPSKDIWATQTDGSVSLNPKHKNIQNLIEEFMLPDDPRTLLAEPQSNVANINSTPVAASAGLMGKIVGGQRVAAYPYASPIGGEDQLLKIQDRWDFGADTQEKEQLKQYILNKIKGKPNTYFGNVGLTDAERSRVGGYNTDPSYYTLKDETTGKTKGQLLNEESNRNLQSMAKRLLLEHGIMKDSPWVSQRAWMARLPKQRDIEYDNPGYAMVPSTADGQYYPGQSTYAFNPRYPHSSAPIKYETQPFLEKLRAGDYVHPQ